MASRQGRLEIDPGWAEAPGRLAASNKSAKISGINASRRTIPLSSSARPLFPLDTCKLRHPPPLCWHATRSAAGDFPLRFRPGGLQITVPEM